MSNKVPDSRDGYRLLTLVGGLPLLAAMVVDSVAVVGRHLRVPLNGSIEIVQFSLLIAGATAIVIATLASSHARVRLLVDRIPKRAANWCRRATQLLSAIYFLALTAGSAWLAADLWLGHEQSELLELPYRPLRATAILATLLVATIFARRALGRAAP